MTDEHGSDSPPPHEEIHEQDHQSPSGDAGAWSDDHPPVDDFSDASATSEESASASQEAAVESDEGGLPAAPPSRSMLPLFAGIGGILLLGAIVYWQFGHSSPPPPMMAPTAAPKSSSSASSTSGTNSVASASTSKTSAQMPKKVEESDLTSLYKPANDGSSPPTPPTAPTTAMATTPEPAAPPPPAMPAAAPMPPPAPSVAVTPPAPVAPPPPAADSRIDALATRLETLEKLVQNENQQLNQLSNMVAANQAMPPVSNQISPALEDRLNKIEQSVMQLEHSQVAKAPAAVTMPAESSSAEATSEVVSKPVTHHTVKRKTASKKTKKKAHHNMQSSSMQMNNMAPMSAMPMAMPTSSQWVLRAATPTEAWVSTDARSAELKHVQVGDSLSGIGQIRAIRQTPSGWEIEGTTGTIR